METRIKIKKLTHGLQQIAYSLVGLSIVFYLVFTKEKIDYYNIYNLFALSSFLIGIHLLLKNFTTLYVLPKWEKVFPMLNTSSRVLNLKKRRVILILNILIDLSLIITVLSFVLELGFNWRIPLIVALVIYVICLAIRASLPIQKEYDWTYVYPELAMGCIIDENNNDELIK